MLSIFLLLLLRYNLVIGDCGFPALPDSTKINLYKKRYEEHSHIQYECDAKNKILIEGKTIRCLNGKWEGNTPKCGQNLLLIIRL